MAELLAAYVAHLERNGKPAAARKGRQAGKLRSYLRAAFQTAIRSRTDPAAPLSMRSFGITVNPLTSIDTMSQFNRTRDRTLAAEELGAFIKRLNAIEDVKAGTLTLYDRKGSRKQPRRHVLPLTRKATEILARLIGAMPADAPSIFASNGKAPAPEALSAFVSEIAASMASAGEARSDFNLCDIRRTCEALLASIGISSDVRAQIQSHNLRVTSTSRTVTVTTETIVLRGGD